MMPENATLRRHLDRFRSGGHLPESETAGLFEAMITSLDEPLLADLLSAWNDKGITCDELFSLVSLMRSRMRRINSVHEIFVDIVGTGGSRSKTFNVSTAAAFVTAGAGVPVAKHGNRAATSTSGSADVLDLLKIRVEAASDAAERCLNECGQCFMFAPRFHSLSAPLAAARRSLGKPTIFNILGPLCNPASAPHHVIGVSDPTYQKTMADVLLRLGTRRSWIVHGENGLDEITLDGATRVLEVDGAAVSSFEVSAQDFGVREIHGDLPSRCSPEESAAIIRAVLENERTGTDAENLVLINAAAAIYITGNADALANAYEQARNSIRSGAAAHKLRELVRETNE